MTRLEYPVYRTQVDVYTDDPFTAYVEGDPEFDPGDLTAGYQGTRWFKPEGAQFVQVLCIGSGGGGGSGCVGAMGTLRGGGHGGSGGAINTFLFPAALLPDVVVVRAGKVSPGVGALGGVAVSAPDSLGAGGSNGYASSFGNLLLAAGGHGGRGGSAVVLDEGVVEATRTTLSLIPAGVGGYNANPSAPALGAPGGGGGQTILGMSSNSGQIGVSDVVTGNGVGRVSAMVSGVEAQITLGGPGADAADDMPGPGGSGAGGTASTTADGGAGGAGGSYGAGGGGGGSTTNGFTSGAGGTGGPGVVVVTTFF